ncbi:fibronectin type III domain-containing protein [Bacteroides reticulotermitis]|uniref:fibronectin type III domain-containing protein n=1 Tax=Bacteroides reticulotermitis TaxID=1133319 RepID=UPI003A89156D
MLQIKTIRLHLILLLTLIGGTAYAQDTVSVIVKPNVTKDRIQLRWAVNTPSAWYYTNRHGFIVERHTLMRDGGILDTPEKVILTPTPLKPRPLNDWEQIAQVDTYAAIIAQALYGQDFEVSGGQKNISEIIALSQEQEQRYAMSLFAADMSYPAALFAGWGYEDTTARDGERYLYRIVPVNPDGAKKVIEVGSIYVGLEDYQPLPRPLELDAIWGNQSVMVTWNSKLLEKYYSAYHLERSDDGTTFKRLSETPIANMMENDRMFYNDAIDNDKTYYYRLIGLTSFSQQGPVSDTIQGKGISKLIYNPIIAKAVPNEKGEVEVTWDFDEKGNAELSSFELRRGDTDKGPFLPVVSGIVPASRTTVYEKPLPENYLIIAAISKTGDETISYPHLLQMEDSIPPAVPQGLEGRVDTTGVVHLKWTANTDSDILGYRIFRGQTEGEELIPITDIAVKTTEFKDSVNIYNLNTKVYYAITALDKRYNQSEQTPVVELDKPDMIKPSPPFITKCEATERGVQLEWVTGKETLKSYLVSRLEKRKGYRELIKVISDPGITHYLDSTAVGDVLYSYDIVAVNRSFIESDPSPSISVRAKSAHSKAIIKSFKTSRAANGIQLKWDHTVPDAKIILIYRKEGESPLMVWKEVEVWERELLDTTAKRNTPYEYLLVIKNREGAPLSAQTKTD